MKFNDQLRFVRQNMKKNKMRLFMTVLATAMGCSFLIVLASVGFGLQKSIVDGMVGDRLVTAIDVNSKDSNKHKNSDINDEDIDFFHTIPHVKAVTYRNFIQQGLNPQVDGMIVNREGTLQVDFEAEKQAGFKLSEGRVPQNGDEVVVGYHIRLPIESSEGNTVEKMPDASEWLNKKLNVDVEFYVNGKKLIEKMELTIVGVAERPAKEWLQDRTIYIGKETLKKIEAITGTQNGEVPYFEEEPTRKELDKRLSEIAKPTDNRTYHQVEVIANNAANVKEISELIREKHYFVHSIADELKQVNVMFLIMKIGLVFIGTIAVLIASIGIFNTMTMAVTERAQDIGIMKAIGAHPSIIKKIFLLESAIIGLLGAVIGTIVSYLISFGVNAGLPMLIRSFMDEEVPQGFLFSIIPPYLAILACFIALGVAMLSGYRPAKRATRIDVLRALRRDV
ncbi:ABC transporter permease [Paenibacillus sp. GSMTC-2017]|uniref:ABC transporter permease n=1 Tax=Paenibacillus sp. GSMTC-2017 TaxID=2794350 RepID=UPI0018D8F016|nr:FtsX-like permease family protein [Paenibacillus sp. GSMTC-2017]MBH5319726.1 ABC transporter permease [Paenibacillus sp. GSMTC-2017]